MPKPREPRFFRLDRRVSALHLPLLLRLSPPRSLTGFLPRLTNIIAIVICRVDPEWEEKGEQVPCWNLRAYFASVTGPVDFNVSLIIVFCYSRERSVYAEDLHAFSIVSCSLAFNAKERIIGDVRFAQC